MLLLKLTQRLLRQKVDMVVGRIPISNYYRSVMDFSIPLTHENWVTLQKESTSSTSMAGLFTPFDPEVKTFFTRLEVPNNAHKYWNMIWNGRFVC